jgi:hypothetical protein
MMNLIMNSWQDQKMIAWKKGNKKKKKPFCRLGRSQNEFCARDAHWWTERTYLIACQNFYCALLSNGLKFIAIHVTLCHNLQKNKIVYAISLTLQVSKINQGKIYFLLLRRGGDSLNRTTKDSGWFTTTKWRNWGYEKGYQMESNMMSTHLK